MSKRQQQQGKRSDNRSTAEIGAAGWVLTKTDQRYVATKRVIEDDHTITMRYESDYTLGGLASQVARRERES
jgi:hypothetical protein